MLEPFLTRLSGETITPTAKGLPERAYGATVADFLETAPRIEDFWTPLVTLSDEAMRHNLDLLAGWASEQGLGIMPHGKTMMAPALWQRQLCDGAGGRSHASRGQVRRGPEAGLAG